MNSNRETTHEIINEENILDNTKDIPKLLSCSPEYYQKIKEIHEYIKSLTYYMNLQMPTPCSKCNRILEYECIECIEQK